ncbi:MAG TPA: serine--tRNA ligase [Candidatus Bathyarchaeia archaeon]|nr:serine--tRNA ligase [Candidatus Bathyarchaeia archaeon]
MCGLIFLVVEKAKKIYPKKGKKQYYYASLYGYYMIDLTLLRQSPETIIALLKKKDPAYDGQLLFDLDKQMRALLQEIELLRHRKNELAKVAKGGVTDEIRQQSIALTKELKVKEAELEGVEKKFHDLFMHCPNIPAADIPDGGKEVNQVVKTVGQKPSFSFLVKNHVDLGTALGWFQFDTAARLAGSNFAFYAGDGVKLLYALSMFMLKNNISHGYEVMLPSVLVNEQALEVASNFPKFKDQVYSVTADNMYLTPTAEVNLANVYYDHIFSATDLPIRMTSWTSCFRREAGTYGATERGLIRIHQFEKVELYTLCEPEYSYDELDRMIACAEAILQKLELHYRISLLAAQDCSFPSAKTYDIEVWLPGQNMYYEVSSCSNCTDFQARRGRMRYKEAAGEKTKLVHTLNASSLALPRLMVAIMETYQQADGSIAIPAVLRNEGIFTL